MRLLQVYNGNKLPGMSIYKRKMTPTHLKEYLTSVIPHLAKRNSGFWGIKDLRNIKPAINRVPVRKFTVHAI